MSRFKLLTPQPIAVEKQKLQKFPDVEILHRPTRSILIENNAIRANELLLGLKLRFARSEMLIQDDK